jgi:inosine-uridine nucleoside N-ribohydrolase
LIDNSKKLAAIAISQEKKALVQSKFAPLFIAEQIRKYSEELCIITFGPLTNLAIAFHQTQ